MILNMDSIRQDRTNEGPIFNFAERHHRQSLNKKIGTHVQKFMIFMTLKK